MVGSENLVSKVTDREATAVPEACVAVQDDQEVYREATDGTLTLLSSCRLITDGTHEQLLKSWMVA